MLQSFEAQLKLHALAQGKANVVCRDIFVAQENMFDVIGPRIDYIKSELQNYRKLKVNVPVSLLSATQTHVEVKTLLKYLKPKSPMFVGEPHPIIRDIVRDKIPPLAIKWRGRYYLMDGHHRAAAGVLRELPTVPCIVVSLENVG